MKKINRADIVTIVDFVTVALLLVFAAWNASESFLHTPPYVDPVRYPVRGIDVSRHNGMMNLDAARRDGIDFVFIKASEGASMHDENFRLNYDKAWHAGLKIGAYHFFRFDADGVEQAVNFLQAIGERRLDLGVAVDVEQTGNPKNVSPALIAERLAAMAEYLNLKGYRVMFYTNRDGFYNFLADEFRGYPLWICSFSGTPINEEWTFWQYNHRGHVAGIRGNVDLDVFCGSREEFEKFCADTRDMESLRFTGK